MRCRRNNGATVAFKHTLHCRVETSGVIDKISVEAYDTGYDGEGQEPKGVEADGAEMPRLALRDIIDKRAVLQEAV